VKLSRGVGSCGVPLPAAVARFNRRVTNRITRRIAPWAPGLGVVVHRGRRSGRAYETPVNVFRTADGYAIALTYGRGDWVRNVLHGGTAELVTRRRRHVLTNPRVVHDESHARFPLPARVVLGLIHADEVLLTDAT
jgi:deazaflavin-dependent oxidoreductase (nitroreductase family)